MFQAKGIKGASLKPRVWAHMGVVQNTATVI